MLVVPPLCLYGEEGQVGIRPRPPAYPFLKGGGQAGRLEFVWAVQAQGPHNRIAATICTWGSSLSTVHSHALL